MFNSDSNHQCNCPFCNNIAVTILKTHLLLGSVYELNYSELCHDSKQNTNGYGLNNSISAKPYSTCQSTGNLHMQQMHSHQQRHRRESLFGRTERDAELSAVESVFTSGTSHLNNTAQQALREGRDINSQSASQTCANCKCL